MRTISGAAAARESTVISIHFSLSSLWSLVSWGPIVPGNIMWNKASQKSKPRIKKANKVGMESDFFTFSSILILNFSFTNIQ